MTPLYHSQQPPIPATSGIYKITCTVTGLFYIGSATNLHNRWKNHRNYLQRNAHGNQKLQRAWNKYGEQSFIFEIIEFVLSPFLLTREQYWLDKLNPFGKKGFNIARIAGSTLGAKLSPITCAKMSASRLGREFSLETRTKISKSLLGKPGTNLGKKFSAEHCAKIKASGIVAKAGKMKTLIVTDPNGVEYTAVGIHQFCIEHHLDRRHLVKVADGKYKHHKGWKARYPETDTGHLPSPEAM